MTPARRRVGGAALLAALLTVALVAIFAGQALWRQWRSVEIETADRSRLQVSWLLGGTLDWARARLRDDGRRAAAVDHAGEAWAQGVSEMPLADFLAGAGAVEPASSAGAAPAGGPEGATLSLQLRDAQGKMNVLNLLEGQALSPLWLRAFTQLFSTLGLPAAELATLTQNLQAASAAIGVTAGAGGTGVASETRSAAPLLPQQAAQLVWLGLAPATLAALQAHVTLLPARTPVNLNSASAEVLQAMLPGFTRADAERVVAQRQGQPLASVAALTSASSEGQYSVNARFFELHTELRLGPYRMAENALLQRDGADVRTLWRRRVMADTPVAAGAVASAAAPR